MGVDLVFLDEVNRNSIDEERTAKAAPNPPPPQKKKAGSVLLFRTLVCSTIGDEGLDF